MIEPIPSRLLRAYRLTQYRAAGVAIRVGRRAPDALFMNRGTRTAALLTAWNPPSRRMPAGWNRRMQQRLRLHLRRFPVVDAAGTLHRWHEEMVLVRGDQHPIIRLAVRFRQHGVVLLRRGQIVRLRLLGAKRQALRVNDCVPP